MAKSFDYTKVNLYEVLGLQTDATEKDVSSLELLEINGGHVWSARLSYSILLNFTIAHLKKVLIGAICTS